MRRQQLKVSRPFQGLDRSQNPEDIDKAFQTKAHEVVFEQGMARKRPGRGVIGDSVQYPLDGEVLKMYSFNTLDGRQRILAFTSTTVYVWKKGAARWTSITGTETFSVQFWSCATYVNRLYFTGNGTEDIYYWDIGDATITALSAGYTGQVLGVYGERLCIFNTYESSTWNRQRMRWSNVGDATTWTADDFNDMVDQMGDDGVEEAGKLANSYAVYGKHTVVEVSYTGSTTSPFAFIQRVVGEGLASRRGLVIGRAGHFYWAPGGLMEFNLSLVAKPIDQKINAWLFDNLNADYFDKCVLVGNAKWDELVLYYPDTSSTTNDKFLALSLKTGVWTEGSREATAAAQVDMSGALTIDELEGTIDSLSSTIDALGAPSSELRTYVGTEDGYVFSEFEGLDLVNDAVDFDFQTKDFVTEDDSGVCWMSLEYEALGDAVTVSYSEDHGVSWTQLTAEVVIDDLTGTIDALSGTIDALSSVQGLTSAWIRYRHDFEVTNKNMIFRFRNRSAGEDARFRWIRPHFLVLSSGGTLPT